MSSIIREFNFLLDNIRFHNKDTHNSLSSIMRFIETSEHPMLYVLPLINSFFKENNNLKDRFHRIAYYIDNWKGNPYHSSSHHAKVVFVSALLGRWHNLSVRNMERLLITASIHDLDYEVGHYDMETQSIKRALELGFINDYEFDDILKLNHVTKFPNWRESRKNFSPCSVENILSDADLAPSFAISFNQNRSETEILEEELKTKISLDTSVSLLNKVGIMYSMIDTFFEDNQKNIKEEYKKLANM